ncbi:MAG TPA: type II toxin-antitoxin system HicB family antitoxin [Candidatus Eisenbergiella intestinipullorum]|nr:type II toxin-antitoxin system HicB family antitoxin [Candidatus Eisenbergiella intestinipullorum]
MTFVYPAVFTPQREGGYRASFPDLACCEAFGADLEDAVENAMDAAYNWICSELEEEDCFLPNQTAVEDISLQEGELVRKIMVRVKLLPDSE